MAAGREAQRRRLGRVGRGLLILLPLLQAAPATAQTPTCPSGPPCQGGPLPGPLPLFPPSNWWNLDISSAPLDPGSAAFISSIGGDALHPDFGGTVDGAGGVEIYGLPYVVVAASQPTRTVTFAYDDESDHVGYPIPDEAITQPHWIEGGEPGNQDLRGQEDRHMLIVEENNKYLYELYNVFWDGTKWLAASGAFFDMKTNDRRPEGWTSADAAGLAILPGLVRYDEVYGPGEIAHAFRVTLHVVNGHVYPASHDTWFVPGALPLGARLRLKAGKDLSGLPSEVQKIGRAMKKYGLIVADIGTDMFVSGTFDARWDNDVLNPAFAALTANDFEVVQLGWHPPSISVVVSIDDVAVVEGDSGTTTAAFTVSLSGASSQTITVDYATGDGTAHAPGDYLSKSGTLTFAPGVVSQPVSVSVVGDTAVELEETFVVNLSGATNAVIVRGQGVGTILDDDAASLSTRELSHGSEEVEDLAAQAGPVADVDYYRLAQAARSSYEVVVDGVSGDIQPLVLERLGSDNATVLQASVAVGTGSSRSLRWENPLTATVTNEHIRVASGGCTTTCGPQDEYRIRAYETTYTLPRFNNSGTQLTVLIVQNPTSEAIGGTLYFWSGGGALLYSKTFSVGAKGVYVLNTSGVFELQGTSGAVTVANDGRYGDLVGKAVALEPATGFSFDSPMLPRGH
jgi:Calx-beta domain